MKARARVSPQMTVTTDTHVVVSMYNRLQRASDKKKFSATALHCTAGLSEREREEKCILSHARIARLVQGEGERARERERTRV